MYFKKPIDYEYWKHPEKGYPKTVKWIIIAGEGPLSQLQETDIIFDKHDEKIRKIELK